jgi:folate-dependent phosphoribosylglycinamide formyltransferase PurN
MDSAQVSLDRPIRIVLFTSGPGMTPEVRKFLLRLESDAGVQLLAIFCQADQRRFAVVRDLWQRRGVLAFPLLATRYAGMAVALARHPRAEVGLRRMAARLRDQTHTVQDIHQPAVLARVAALAPDLGLVYGSPILKPALFEIPVRGTLGIHHGKVPEYRGNKTTFWAMYNGEKVAGVTIQKINAGLDTGEIVKEGHVEIGNRSLRAVWRALEALGRDLYMEAIAEVKAGTAVYRPQVGTRGPLYHNPKPRDFLLFGLRWLQRRFAR